MRKILSFISAIIFVLSACDNKESAQTNSKPVVKIGVTVPLTGDISVIGLANKAAIEVAAEHIKKMQTKNDYQFIFEDNAYQIMKTQNAVRKLIDIDKVDALVDVGSTSGKVVSIAAEKNKIIHLNTLSSDNEVALGKYNFVNWTSPESEAEKMIEVIKEGGYQNIAIFDINDAGVIAITDALEEAFSKYEIPYFVTRVNTGTKDLKAEINKAKQKNPDFYIVTLHIPEIYVFIKQLREAGVTADVSSIEAFTFFEDLSPFEDVKYVDAAEGKGDIIEEIKRHNNSNNTFGISNSYDNIMLLVKAFESADNKENAVDELLKIKVYDGLTGRLEQDENGIFQSEAVIKKVINGKPVVVRE